MTDARYPRSPSIGQVRAICDAVARLVRWADRSGPPWSDMDLLTARERVGEIDGIFRAIRKEADGMKPKPMGARGWGILVDRTFAKIQDATQRLTSTWQLSRQLPLANIGGGIDDHPAPVLESSDRTTLVNAMDTLAEEAERAERETAEDERETQTEHAPILEELDSEFVKKSTVVG